MKLLYTTLFLCISGFVFSQFSVGRTTITFNDPARTGGFGSGGGPGRQIQTEVYYPATSAGTNTPAANGQFPVIVFGHGFAMAWDAYQNLWERYVPMGYIMAFPRTESGLLPAPSHNDFGLDLKLVAERMQVINTTSGSVLNGKVGVNTAIMGHSMGGGASILASQNNTFIKTVIGLAPAETNPSAVAAAPNVSVPALIFSGDADGVTPPAEHHIPIYNGLNSTCKSFATITGGGHCYYNNTNFNCDFGESTSSPNISITRVEQQTRTYSALDHWLNYILKGDCGAYDTFLNALNTATGIVGQTICPTTSATPTATITPAGATTFCQGNSVNLNANTGAGLTYQWMLNGNPIMGATSSTYNAIGSGSYTVVVSNASGCSATSSGVTVTVTDGPTVTIVPFQNVCNNAAIFTLTGGSPTGGTYSGNGVTNNQFNPATGAGTYAITYTYSDAQNCQGTANANLVVEDCTTNSLTENQYFNHTIFPNPFGSELNILFNEAVPAMVNLYDATGKLVFKENVKGNQLKLNTEKLKSGNYTIKFEEVGIGKTIIKQ
jgi:pimeloyl-ACP methyl ester carboxylesterase